MTTSIDGRQIQGMVGHWLTTPEFGYLGSSYGRNVETTLFAPLASGRANAVLDKLRRDVPVLGLLPAGSVNLFAQTPANAPDRLQLFVAVGGEAVIVDQQGAFRGDQ